MEGGPQSGQVTSYSRFSIVSWPVLLGLSGFFLVCAMGLGLADQDVYLHIAVGRWIIAHGYVPSHDPFSFTRTGAPWVAQEWASELLSVLVYRLAGWSGLVFLGAASFGATLAYLTRFLVKRMEPLHALLLAFLAASMMLPYLVDRPHELVWPLTVIWIGGLVQASEERRAPRWWLLAVMLLWANMHGSFILGLVLMFPIALDALQRQDKPWRKVAKQWLPFCLSAVAVTLLNPRGYRLLLFPFQLLGIKEIMTVFKDWLPPDLQHLGPLHIWLIAVVGAAFAGRVRLSLVRAGMVLALLYIALEHFRNVALLGMISPLLLASPVAEHARRTARAGKDNGALDLWFALLARPSRSATLWIAGPIACIAAMVALNLRHVQPPGIIAPRAALNAVISRVPVPRIFNDVNFGDYLIFRGVPVFVDARADVYGQKFLKQTFDSMSLAPGGDLQELLRKYKINAILLGRWMAATHLIAVLPEWKRVYEGPWAVAYVRRRVGTR